MPKSFASQDDIPDVIRKNSWFAVERADAVSCARSGVAGARNATLSGWQSLAAGARWNADASGWEPVVEMGGEPRYGFNPALHARRYARKATLAAVQRNPEKWIALNGRKASELIEDAHAAPARAAAARAEREARRKEYRCFDSSDLEVGTVKAETEGEALWLGIACYGRETVVRVSLVQP